MQGCVYKNGVCMGFKTERYREIIVPIVVKYLPDAKIILFGSRARDDERPSSNIDIALDVGHEIDDETMSYIRNDIQESELPIECTIVDFNAVSATIQETILEDAITWHN